MLEWLRVKRLRGIEDSRLTGLYPVNVLEGATGCGKSTILEAVTLLASGGNAAAALYHNTLNRNAIDSKKSPIEAWSPLFHKRMIDETIDVSSGDGTTEHRFVLQMTTPGLPPNKTAVALEGGGAKHHELEICYTERERNAPEKTSYTVKTELQQVQRKYGSSGMHKPVRTPVTITTRRDRARTITGRYCHLRTTGRHHDVLEALQRAVPYIRSIETIANPHGRIEVYAETPAMLPMSHVGTGATEVLRIAIAAACATPGSVLLVDNLGDGLDEAGVKAVAWAIGEAAKRGAQVFTATTQAQVRQTMHEYDEKITCTYFMDNAVKTEARETAAAAT